MKGQYRSVNFDLSTKAMQEAIGSKTKGYSIIQKSMKEFGFSHRQGSGYRSDKPMSKEEVKGFIKAFGKANPWLADCVKAFDVTNSGRTDYDFTETLRTAAQAAKAETESVFEGADTVTDGAKQTVDLETFLSMPAPESESKERIETLSLEEFMALPNPAQNSFVDVME